MHKEGKWAAQIISLQEDDGKWGWFHSLSQFYNSSMTTEQALRRLEILGFSIEDVCIQKAVQYMNNCLTGKEIIPDRQEKVQDWNVFSSLILATWIRRFTKQSNEANIVARKWAGIISQAFQTGQYNKEAYYTAYQRVLQPHGGRILEPYSFYQVSIVSDLLDPKSEDAYLDYLIHREEGIYYIYGSQISHLPEVFAGKTTSRYLGAIELLAEYKHAGTHLDFVVKWLLENRKDNGKWDLSNAANDKVYFPLSDNWRSEIIREQDCSERINNLLMKLSQGVQIRHLPGYC